MLPLEAQPNEAEKQAAIAMILAGLGEAELRVVASYTGPIFWMLRRSDKTRLMKNGSMFLLNTGTRVIAVTAAHVVEECLQDTKSSAFVQCMVGSKLGHPVPFFLGDRLIDAHRGIDIATFWLTPAEIRQTGLEVLAGFYYPLWPPRLPQIDRGVTYCGFPGNGRRWLAPKEISFGCVAMAGVVSNCSENSLSVQIEREHLSQVLGNEAMPENYDFGGISGGPVLAIIQTPTIRSWMPAGVIFEGPNPGNATDQQAIAGLEIIRARPMHFIKADGMLDITLWEQSNF